MVRLPENLEKAPPRAIQDPEDEPDIVETRGKPVPSHPFDKDLTRLVSVIGGADPEDVDLCRHRSSL